MTMDPREELRELEEIERLEARSAIAPQGDAVTSSEYIWNRAKKGIVQGTVGMGGLVADIAEMGARDLRNELANPETLFNRMTGGGGPPVEDPAPFDKIKTATDWGYGIVGANPEMEAPNAFAKYAGAAAEFAAGGFFPSAWVIKSAKHKFPAIITETTSSVAGGVLSEDFGFGGTVIGGLGGPASGTLLYKAGATAAPYAKAGASRVAELAGLGDTQVGQWLGAEGSRPLAGRDLTRAINASPQSGLNLGTSERTAQEIEVLGGRVFNPTLGQRSGSEGVIALEKGIARSSPESLGRHSTTTREAEESLRAAETAAFPTGGAGPDKLAGKVITTAEKALENRLSILNDAERRIGDQFPDMAQQSIGEALNSARIDAMNIARGVKNQKYQDVYRAADKAGISEDMSDVAGLAASLRKKDVFQRFPSVFGEISARYKPGKPKPSGLLDADGRPINAPERKAVPAKFSELHSLVRETSRQLRQAVRTGDSEGVYYLGQVEKMLDDKITKYSGAQYGDVAAKLADADDFFVNKYATVFREGVGGRLAAKNRYGELINDEQTVQRFFSPSGIDDFNEIFAGSPGAREVLESGVLGLFAKAALRDGVVNPRAAETWIRRHGETLNKMPQVLAKIRDGKTAQEAIISARQTVKARQKNIDKTYIAKLANTENPEAMIGAALDNPVSMRSLSMLARDQKSRAIMARAVMQALPSAAARAKKEPLDFLIENSEALRPLLQRIGPQHEKNLRTIASARGILARVETPGTVEMHGASDPIKEQIGSSVNELLNSWRGVARRTGSVHSAVGSATGKFFNTRAFKAQRALMEAALYDPKIAEDLMRAITSKEITPAITNRIGNHLLSVGYRVAAQTAADYREGQTDQ